MRYNYITIEGCIGAGKTTLSTRIAHEFGAKLILEQFEENAFLPKFYKDPEHYAFPLEMSFMAERYRQLRELLSHGDLFASFTIADYFIDKCIIFSKNTLQPDEYMLYTKLYNIITSFLPRPELLIYLYKDIDLLIENIKKRGRDYEQNISFDYLSKLQDGYLNHLKSLNNIPVVVVDTNNIDFVENQSDYDKMVELLNQPYKIGFQRIIL
ncbi:MAG: deoxynucleoside kinase [Bacteroidota bacterium]